jgi:hypothetical protein
VVGVPVVVPTVDIDKFCHVISFGTNANARSILTVGSLSLDGRGIG